MKNKFIDSVKKQLVEWDARLDEIVAEAREATADMKASYDVRIENVKLKRDILRARLDQLMDATDDAWKDLRSGVENAWEDLRSAFDDDEEDGKDKN